MLILLLSVALAGDSVPPLSDLVPETPSFQTAKKRLYRVHEANPVTLYCGCSYSDKVPDLSSCGLEGEGLRWERTEAEHVVPASVLGEGRSCWEIGGRDTCLSEDPVFAAAHNDLHNLYPSVGQMNAYRSDYGMGLIPEEVREWGSCDFEVSNEGERVEPRPEVRGDIARIYFYMGWMHGVQLSEGQRRLFLHWHQTDPVDEWERKRDELIEGLQGNSNPFVR